MKPTMDKRSFTEEEIETMAFDHQYNERGSIVGGLVVLGIEEDGYARVASLTPNGLSRTFQNAWSGCLSPSYSLNKDQIALLKEARKLPQ
jgi:hypothetical protein